MTAGVNLCFSGPGNELGMSNDLGGANGVNGLIDSDDVLLVVEAVNLAGSDLDDNPQFFVGVGGSLEGAFGDNDLELLVLKNEKARKLAANTCLRGKKPL